MWNRARTTTLACLAFVGAASYAPDLYADDAPPDPFAGEWAVAVTPDAEAVADGQGPFSEAVLFHEGQFSAAVFAMFGFSPASYELVTVEDRPTFVAILTSEDRGTLAWTGHATPTGMTGTLSWTRADGSVHSYAISATRPES